MPSSAKAPVTIIDGRSGAGKSAFATNLAEEQSAVLVSIDDVYPGWDGLDAGSWHIHQYLVTPFLAGLTGRYRPWLWDESRRGDWIEIPPGKPLIVEGCGAIRRDSPLESTTRIWIETEDEIRLARALERDGEMYAPHWTRWALQEERFLALHHSRDIASEMKTLG
jgi:hypothetical protein